MGTGASFTVSSTLMPITAFLSFSSRLFRFLCSILMQSHIVSYCSVHPFRLI